jgi:hypothetical protein
MTTAADQYIPKPPPAVQSQIDAVNAMIAGQQPPAEPAATPPSPPPAAQPAPAATPPAAPAAPAPQDENTEQLLKTTKGRLDKQVEVNRNLSARVSELEGLIASMAAAGQTPPGQPPAPEPRNLITDAEREEYGEPFMDVVGRRVQEVVDGKLHELDAKLAKIDSQVQGVTAKTQLDAKQQMYADLDNSVPNWKVINRAPEFLEWLSEPDEMSGRLLGDLLREAFSRQEAKRVVRIFQRFTEATGTQPAPQDTQPAPPAQPGSGGKVDLASLAAPGRARSAPDPLGGPSEPNLYTSAQIAKFTHDKLMGKWKGREDQAAAIDADIIAAGREGRIVG